VIRDCYIANRVDNDETIGHLFEKMAQPSDEFVEALQAACADNNNGEEEDNDVPETESDGDVLGSFDDGRSVSQM
jgi:hypothetical protein